MTGMNNTDYKLFTTIVRMKQKTLLKSMTTFLKKYYSADKVIPTADYILCEGNVPIMLVAHMDTVFKIPPEKIYYDQHQHVIWSPQGLGADDRAGVFSILKIVQNGYRPHICLTTDEEVGGVGVRSLIKHHPTTPYNIKYIIELDRQGEVDCVFYSCDNEPFQEYVEQFGFITEWGTFSDISVICPAWKIAGVNLSVGYLNEHSKIETLHTDALYATINKVQKMIEDIDNAESFTYIPAIYERYWYKMSKAYGWSYPCEDGYWDDYDYYNSSHYPLYPTGPYKCVKCGRSFSEDDVFLVKTNDGKEKNYYCVDCVSSNINWCEKCGEPFEVKQNNEIYCCDCKNKK